MITQVVNESGRGWTEIERPDGTLLVVESWGWWLFESRMAYQCYFLCDDDSGLLACVNTSEERR
jgi:hypothetical protein